MDAATPDLSEENKEPNAPDESIEPDQKEQTVAKPVIPHLQFASQQQRHVVDEGKSLELDVSATCNVKELHLRYQLSDTAPKGATLNAQSGRLTWTPSESDGPNTFEFDVVAEAVDGASTIRAAESIALSIEVREVNHPPQIAPIERIVVNEGERLRQTVRASDQDIPATAVTYSLSDKAPRGATIDAATGELTWTPDEGQGPGEYRIPVFATDGNDPLSQSEALVHVEVLEVNQRPKLSLPQQQETMAGELVTFHAFASDDDWPLQRLTFNLRPIIANAHLDAMTGRFRWTPALRHIGERTFMVTVRDDAQPPLFDTGNVTVVVRPPNEVITKSGVKLVKIPGGVFRMGRREGDATLKRDFDLKEVKAYENERPLHTVKISRDFYVGQTEVTVAQFRGFIKATNYRTSAERYGGSKVFADGSGTNMKMDKNASWKNPGFRQMDNHPVVHVSWNDAMAFCNWLSKVEGIRFRLPTEAEWEYFCRAGTNTRFWFGNDPNDLVKYANVRDASFHGAHSSWGGALPGNDGFANTAPVASFQSNPFGLYDVHGNVWEWCQDWDGREYRSDRSEMDPQGPAAGKLRIARGGCFW